MGNNQQDPEFFNTDDWLRVADSSNQVTLWENKANRNFHVQQHKVYTLNKNQLEQEIDLYYRRKNHQRWVAALFFRQESSQEFCVSRSVAHIFIEKIPIRLSDLKDLPIPDVIHTYEQCLLGFQEFAREYGTFKVLPQYIGVNEKGAIKVWAGQQWAQIGIIGGKINEDDMVRSIVDCIEGSTDAIAMQRSGIPIRSYLYRATDKLNFNRALYELKSYTQLVNNGIIPPRLESLYYTRDFQQFMQPLLRSNHELYQTLHRQNYSDLSQVDIIQNEPTFKKVDVPQHRYTDSYALQNNQVPSRQQSITNVPSIMARGEREPTNAIMASRWQTSTAHHQHYSITQPQTQHIISPLQVNYSSAGQSVANLHQNQPSNYTFNLQRQPSASRFTPPQPSSDRPLSSHQNGYHPPAPLASQHVRFNTLNREPQIKNNFIPIQSNMSSSRETGNIIYGSNHSIPPRQQIISQRPEQKRSQIHQNNRANRPIPQSIIMELYKSEDRFGEVTNQLPGKELGGIRKTISINQEPLKKFQSATIIKEHHNNDILGLPHYEATPTSSNLHSIQELNSEHWKTDNSFSASPAKGQREYYQSSHGRQQYGRIEQYGRIDPNDGKSSEDLLRYLRSYGGSH